MLSSSASCDLFGVQGSAGERFLSRSDKPENESLCFGEVGADAGSVTSTAESAVVV